MNYIFDYTYYRVAKKYFKKDGVQAFTALLTVSLIMFLYLLLSFFAVIFILFNIPQREHAPLWEKVVVLLVMFLIFLYNKKRYNNKYTVFREKWINEPKGIKIKKGIIVILFIISPLIFIMILLSMFNKLNL